MLQSLHALRSSAKNPNSTTLLPSFHDITAEETSAAVSRSSLSLSMFIQNLLQRREAVLFESNLFELFESCYKWLAPSEPKIEKAVGSMVVIVSKCSNGHIRRWMSQKCDGRMPWGNMLLAAGTLFTESNPARVASFFKEVGVMYMSLRTYYKIQRLYLAPAVNRCWENEQLTLLTSLKGKIIAVGGDARMQYYPTLSTDNNVNFTQIGASTIKIYLNQSLLILIHKQHSHLNTTKG